MAWDTTGNAGTRPTDFLGTTDAKPLVVKTNGVEAARVTEAGRVGVGNAAPQNRLHVGNATSSIASTRVNAVVANATADAGIAIAQQDGVNVLVQASGAGGYIGTTSNHPLVLRSNDLDRMAILPSGDVQIGPGGTSIAPSRVGVVVSSVEPDAGIAIAQQSGVNVLVQASGAGGYIGTTSNHPLVLRTNDLDRVVIDPVGNLVVNADILLANADCAEDFDLAEDADGEPGTVMVVDDDGRLRHSEDEYDRRVAGVISGAGTYRPAIVLDRQERAGRTAISLIGKVFCKVEASTPIRVGDLLTTSGTPGHAMSARDPGRAFGAVLGKALRPLAAGRGLIPVLIALQ